MNSRTSIALFGISFLVAASALASEGYVTRNVYLRAGPDAGYPSVARLRAGSQVQIEGCVDGWSWCDVTDGEQRGWVAGYSLREEYEGRRVYLRDYGVQIGIPIVSFELGTYWGDHYRNRSWYGKRERWSHVRPQYRVDEHRSDRREDSHNTTSHGDTRTSVRSGDAARYSPARANEPAYQNTAVQPHTRIDRQNAQDRSGEEAGRVRVRPNESMNAPAQARQASSEPHPHQRSDNRAESARTDSGQARPMARTAPVAAAPAAAAPPRVIAEHNAAARVPRSDAPSKPAREHDKKDAKDDNDGHRHDPKS